MTTQKNKINIIENKKYGVVVQISDEALADEFDDYITENFYLFYNSKLDSLPIEFYFGEMSSLNKVKKLVSEFEK